MMGSGRVTSQRVLVVVLLVNLAFFWAELAGGLVFHSLALLADAAHMLSDVVALTIALLAQRLASRPPTTKHTFGLQRAEVLGAQANGVLLLLAAGWIVYEASRRIGSQPEVVGGGLLAVASAGLVVNVVSAALLAEPARQSLNMRGAFLHMALDAVGSVGAIAAGVAVVVWGAAWVDPAVSIGIAVLVVWSAWRLLRSAAHVLMEGVPHHLDVAEIEVYLASDPAVEDVHHVHVWNLASDVPALSAHVVIEGEVSLHDAQVEGDRLRRGVLERFGIDHVTFELECHGCEEPRSHGH